MDHQRSCVPPHIQTMRLTKFSLLSIASVSGSVKLMVDFILATLHMHLIFGCLYRVKCYLAGSKSSSYDRTAHNCLRSDFRCYKNHNVNGWVSHKHPYISSSDRALLLVQRRVCMTQPSSCACTLSKSYVIPCVYASLAISYINTCLIPARNLFKNSTVAYSVFSMIIIKLQPFSEFSKANIHI